MAFKLKALTLNCWGLPIEWPVGTKDKAQRMNAIADRLSKEDYDVVALQELWCPGDYDMIVNRTAKVYPHAFYFHSGVIGSGTCVLSKHPIFDTLMYRYTLNGYPHHVHRGDWLGGKVAGMAKIRTEDGLIVYVYTTHLHAQYGVDDPYIAHRTVQAFEISQFISQTSMGADVVLAMGDFNLEPHDLGFKLILANTDLNDAWDIAGKSSEDDEGYTSDVPSNCYADKQFMYKARPNGQRIDYILYNSSAGTELTVDECKTDFKKIPGTEINYSDHEGLVATFSGRKNPDAKISTMTEAFQAPLSPPLEALSNILDDTVAILEPAIGRIMMDRLVYSAWLFVLCLIYVYTVGLEIHYHFLAIPMMGLRFVVTLGIAFCLLNGVVSSTIEKKFLIGARDAIRIVHRRVTNAKAN